VACTHYFVFAADGWRQHHDLGGFGFAIAGWNAYAVYAQEAWSTEATANTLLRAGLTTVGILARWGAGCAALEEIFAIRAFRCLNRAFGGLAFAVARWNAFSVFAQKAWSTEATADALLLAGLTTVGILACWLTARATLEEIFTIRAFRCLNSAFLTNCCYWFVATFCRDADAISVSQITFFAEAADDTVFRANWAWMRVFASWSAG